MTADKNNDAHRLALKRYEEARDFVRENRDEQIDDLAFAALKQWPEQIISERKADRRPCLTLSRVLQYVHQVTGDIRQSPPALSTVPVDDKADVRTARVYSGIVRHIERDCGAQSIYVNSAEGAAICGEGHWRLTTEYEDDESANLKIVLRGIRDHLSVTWDPFAQEKDRGDARYCFVTTKIPLDEFKAEYPDADISGFDEDGTESANVTQDWFDGEAVTVAEYWWVETTRTERAFYDDGRALDLEDLDDEARAVASKEAKRRRAIEKRVVRSCLVTGTQMLTEPQVWPGRRIPIFTTIGEEIWVGDKVIRFGIVRPLKDPQRSYNYMRSAGVEAMALAPKAPMTGTPDMIKGHEKIYAKALSSNVDFLPFNPDPLMPGARPMRVEPPNPAIGIAQEAMAAVEDMHAATGIYPASLGARSNETSGRAIIAREKQGDTGTYLYVDNLAHTIKACGREIIYLIPKVYDTQRVVRILGEEGDQGAARVNEMLPTGERGIVMQQTDKPPEFIPGFDVGRYDAEVKVGPTFQTRREEARESLLAFVQAVPAAGVAAADLIAKNMDWPGSEELADRLKPQEAGTPTPEAMKAEADMAKIQAEQQNAQTEAQLRMAELAFEAEKLKFEAQKLAVERERMSHELSMAGMERGPAGLAPAAPLVQIGQMVAQLASAVAQMSQSVAMSAQASCAPKRVVRDENGMAIGIETVAVQ